MFDGCGCLILFPLMLLGAALVRGLSGQSLARRHLISLMIGFVMGAERNQAIVDEIHTVLMNRFVDDNKYAELTTAVASFIPGAREPFYDEVRLAEAFRVFLRQQKISVPDEPQEQSGVWPPPPNPYAPRKDER